MNNLTSNMNFLTPLGFKLKIESPDFANTNYTVISTSLPSVQLSEVQSQFKNFQGFVPGDKVVYDPLDCRIIVNEDMDNYTEIFNWILANQSAETIIKSDLTLTMMTSHKNINKRIRFANAFPVSIGSFEFNVQNSEPEYLQCDVQFRYDYFKFDKSI